MVTRPPSEDSIDAQAAAWVARLQGDDADAAMQAAFQAWLEASAAHGAAFERATEIWAILPGAALYRSAAVARPAPPPRARHFPVRHLALAASLAILLCVGSLAWWTSLPDAYNTAIGEQKVATLEDGSRIALNTDSAVDVRYNATMRDVRLDRGEAMFEVAHNAERPFVVTAGPVRVRAIGTKFIVRRTGTDVSVTLVQGKVAVTYARAAADHAATPGPVLLTPGERLTAPAGGATVLDRQSAEVATAWRRGQAVFTDTPLGRAAAELNRYGGPRIEIDDPRVAALPVSGVFATNDTDEFARAIASLHNLHIAHQQGSLRIMR
jgi:transmembrane sensor